MVETNSETRAMWQSYLDTLPDHHPHKRQELPEVWSFGNTPKMADELGELVLRGIKTATCSRYFGGNLIEDAGPSIILDGKGRPLCVVETFEIMVRRFRDIDVQFASDEGEGDRSLDYWRKVHWDFFTREGEREGYKVHKDMLLECERFCVLYQSRV